ncbi:streptogrisin D [Streptomyces syringium]|uniref:Streptogrisin D n=2 Tax=Streptomyces syringium TaxID=76729 RepID=A0ABS4XZZ6_9ACTN|nr:S1 family peptidase [Streptomyces syringium]MBP2402077.1 streptogrisin D [Streptomyces syringium]
MSPVLRAQAAPAAGPNPTGGAELKLSLMRARTALAAAAAAALAAVTLGPQPAGASIAPEPRALSAAAAGQLARTLPARLKHVGAGAYYDAAARKLVVNITDRKAAGEVREAGAEPRVVRFSQARLASAQSALASRAAIPGTAWVADPRVNRVVVTADPTVTGEKLARLNEVVGSLGETVVVRKSSARLMRYVRGGDAIHGPSARCSLGFNVYKGGKPGFLTAGHCGKAVTDWSASRGGAVIARTVGAGFPGNDHALAEYTDPTVAHRGSVSLGGGRSQTVTGFRDAVLRERVARSGSTTGLHRGKVTGLDATVNYQEGTVTGLIQTDICAEPGDSGGALFAGDRALGLTSGGTGNCALGGTTYYQPVGKALAAYGATLA